jgi:uncharacterized delta-60 repeat protein
MRLFALCALVVLVFAAGRQASAVADAPSGEVLVRQSTLGAIAVRPDGAIVVAGRTGDCPAHTSFFWRCPGRRAYLVEFDRHGHLVPGFGSELPMRRLGGGVFALAIGPEGEVFLAAKGGLGSHLSRFDRQGHLDRSFGIGGVVAVKEVGDRVLPAIKALAVEPDGNVVAAGIARTKEGGQEVFLLRLRRDGSPDPSFGDGQKVLSRSTLGGRLGPIKVEALALMGDGRIVVAGSTELMQKTRSALFAARYLHDGQPDLSFGGDGQSAIAASKRGRTYTEGLAVLPGGEVVLAGSDDTRPAILGCVQPVVAHLLGDGQPDPAFGGRNGEEPGVLRVGSPSDGPCHVQAASVLGDGSVTFALATDGESPLYLDRLTLDGTRDPGFAGADSTALPPLASGYLWHFRLAAGGQITATELVRPGCRPVSGGTKTGFPCHTVLLVARDAQGRLRRGFGHNGIAVLRLPR